MDADGHDRAERASYQAYLIRMWRERRKGTWRASAQSVVEGQVTRFGTLEALFTFLEAQTRDDDSRQLPGSAEEDEQQDFS